MYKKLLSIILMTMLLACNQTKNNNSLISKKQSDSLNKTDKQNSETKLIEENYKSLDFSKIGFELLEKEQIDKLKIGLSTQSTIDLIGQPTNKTKPEVWSTDNLYHQTWTYKDKGIELDIIGHQKSSMKINMITLTKPCDFKTLRKIGIGSSRLEVEKAYKMAIDQSNISDSSIVAGSIYGGIIFTFENKKVKSIFLGAIAE